MQKLLDAVLERVLLAGGHTRSGNAAARGQEISRAIAIINALRAALDHRAGGELAGNLDALYDYMTRRLAEANAEGNSARLDEVAALMRTLKSGWDDIPPQWRRVPGAVATAQP